MRTSTTICLLAGFGAVAFTAAPAQRTARVRAPVAAAHCADGLRAELHRPSFENTSLDAPSRRPTARQLETLRLRAGQRFRAVANAMCAQGRLRPAALRPFRRLLVQQADGADNTAFMSGGHEFGRDTLVFQFVFDQGGARISYSVPDEADLREGLLCWSNSNRYRRMCEERLP